MTTIILPMMAIILAIRVYKEYKEEEQINYVRLLIFCIFIMFNWVLVPANLSETPPFNTFINREVIGVDENSINLFSISIGLLISLALSFVAYANKLEILYYAPISFYLTILASAILNNLNPFFDTFNLIYIYAGAFITVIFFYITGFRLKDNGSLGLAILFSFAIIALAIGSNIIGDSFIIALGIFGLIFSLGKFTPFKMDEEEAN
jgi:hypothetical protein